jgi:hypothetical protein
LEFKKFVHLASFAPMLKKEFQYYLDHQPDFVKQYNNKFIVIKNEQVIGVYNSHTEAYTETVKKEQLGTFLIQHCLPGKESTTQTFNSQVIIHAAG